MRNELDLAIRLIKGSSESGRFHLHTLFTVLGISLGVAFLVLAISIYDGYVSRVEAIIFALFPEIAVYSVPADGSDHGEPVSLFDSVRPGPSNKEVCDAGVVIVDRDGAGAATPSGLFSLARVPAVLDRLRQVPGIDMAAPMIFDTAEFEFLPVGDGVAPLKRPIRILGVSSVGSSFVPDISRLFADAALLEPLRRADERAVLIADELYPELFGEDPRGEDFVGRTLRVKRSSDAGLAPAVDVDETIDLRVVGVFRLGIHGIARNMIITSVPVAQELLEMPGHVTLLALSVPDPYDAEERAVDVADALADSDVLVANWQLVAGELFNNLQLYRGIIIVVLLMSVGISTYNLRNTISIMIMERRRQVGVLMALGLRPGALQRIFVWVGLIQAAVGTTLGVLVGTLLGRAFTRYSDAELAQYLPVTGAQSEVNAVWLALLFGLVIAICCFTALLASRRATALSTVSCLQSE